MKNNIKLATNHSTDGATGAQGTMTWGKQNTEEEAHAQLSYAVQERGLTFLDTAEMYPVPTEASTQGLTDKYIGSWLKAAHVPRDKLTIATKVAGASERITWLRKHGKGTRVRRADILESVEGSLARLGTDYIDLIQIHWPDRYVGAPYTFCTQRLRLEICVEPVRCPTQVSLFGGGAYDRAQEREAFSFQEQLEALGELVAQGKVRYVGVSNETSWGISEWHRLANSDSRLPRVVSIQNSYSLLNRGPFETDLNEACSPRNADVSLLAYSPLAGGGADWQVPGRRGSSWRSIQPV